MKTIGIIGGIAPASTIEYYRLIIARYREQKQDNSYPPILINSIDMTRMLGLIGTQKLAEVIGYLLGEVVKLAHGGADLGLFASNTPHLVFEEIQRQSPIPLISIVEAACRAAEKLGLNKVGLFGTRFTMQSQFYSGVFSRKGITVIAPDSNDQDYIHEKYMSELVNGVYRDATRDRMLSIMDRLVGQEGIQGLILGGTELPFILRGDFARKIPLLNTTRIHVEQIVAQMLSA
jgi:aspartate racemase